MTVPMTFKTKFSPIERTEQELVLPTYFIGSAPTGGKSASWGRGHPQYVSIVPNNVYAKLGAAMYKVMEAILKNIENRLATLATGVLEDVDPFSGFLLCRILFMPSLEQLDLTEWKQFEQLILEKMGWQH